MSFLVRSDFGPFEPLTKPGSDSGSDSGSDRTPDRIESDWYLRFRWRIIILLLARALGRAREQWCSRPNCKQTLRNTTRHEPRPTSLPGSLFSASFSRWNRDPGCGWSCDWPPRIWVVKKSAGRVGQQGFPLDQMYLSTHPPCGFGWIDGHVTSRNQGLCSNDLGRQRRETLGTRVEQDLKLK